MNPFAVLEQRKAAADLSRLPVAGPRPALFQPGTSAEWIAAYKREPGAVIAAMSAAAPGGEARWETFLAGHDQRTVKAMLRAAFPPKPEKKKPEEE